MRKEWWLASASAIGTLLIALGLVRWLAPQLLGTRTDLQLVRVAKEVPPFFDGVFRREDYEADSFIISDPHIKRAKPLLPALGGMGPHDILGFRNHGVPNVADIVAIGDSQTYGNNVMLEENWPSRLSAHLANTSARVYSMAVGGWGATQYLEIFEKAKFLQPRLVIVAFYSGNDALESFMHAYGDDRLLFLRPDPQLTSAAAPQVEFPPPESDWWPITFSDGVTMTFAAKHRHLSNKPHPAVEAGYNIMADVAERIARQARKSRIAALFTIIPTKELVYAPKILSESISAPPDYIALVSDEGKNIRNLSLRLEALANGSYVDVVEPLQQAAQDPVPLYPSNINGHPIAAGYDVIARALAPRIGAMLPDPLDGLVYVDHGTAPQAVYLVREGKLWWFPTHELITANGWTMSHLIQVSQRDVAGLPYGGAIRVVDPGRFGPAARPTGR